MEIEKGCKKMFRPNLSVTIVLLAGATVTIAVGPLTALDFFFGLD